MRGWQFRPIGAAPRRWTGHLQRLTATRSFCPGSRDLGRGDDGAGRTVTDSAAVVQAQRRGDGHGLQHVVVGDRIAQVRLGVQRGVGVALDRDVRHRALEILLVGTVLGAVGGSELRERSRRRQIRPEQVVQRTAAALRQAAVAGVLQLLDA
jgi:hypothetical protein